MERLATAAMPSLNSAMKKVLRTMEGLSHHAKGLGNLSQSLSGLSRQTLPQLNSAAKAMEDSFADVSQQMDEVAKDYKKLQKEHKSYADALTFNAGKNATSETGDSKKTDNSSDQGKKSETIFQKLGTKIKDVLLNTVQKAINALGPMMQAGVENMAKAWPALGQSLDTVKASLTGLSNSMGAMVAPVLMTVLPIFDQIVKAAINAANAIGMFFTKLLGGRETYVKIGEAADGATPSSGSQPEGSANGGLTYEEVPIDSNVAGFADTLLQTLGPAKEALGLLNTELEKLGQFAWQGLVDFYNLFLAPVGEWILGEGIPSFINAITNGLGLIDWETINTSLSTFWTALEPFALNVGEGLLWFWENVLVPLSVWVMNEALPTFLDLLSAAFEVLNPLLEIFQPLGQWLWDSILVPIGEWTGKIFIDAVHKITEKLKKFSDWIKDHRGEVLLAEVAVSAFLTAFFAIKGIETMQQCLKGVIPWILKTAGAFFAGNWQALLIAGAFAVLATGITLLVTNWDKMNGFQKAVAIFALISTAALAAAAALGAFHSAWSLGAAVAGIAVGVATLAIVFSSIKGFEVPTPKMKSPKVPQAPTYTPPQLASGAVLTQRTLFEGGEYPGARTNPEIVSPLSMMKGAFQQALAEQGGVGGSFTAEQPIELSLDGDVFYRAMVKIKQNRGVAIGSAFAEAY